MTTLPAARLIVELEDVTLDLLCFEHALSVLRDRRRAGKLPGYFEAVYQANPGLADAGTILPRGTVVQLPAFVVQTENAPVARLWDD